MVRGITCAVALFLFTGCVCLDDLSKVGSRYSLNLHEFDDNEEAARYHNALHLVKKYIGDPLFILEMVEAAQNLKMCFSSVVDRSIPDDVSEDDFLEELIKSTCRIFVGAQPCLLDFMPAVEKFLPYDIGESIIYGLQKTSSIICVNDGQKLAGALMDIVEEDEQCFDEMKLELQICSNDAKIEKLVHGHIDPCSSLNCVKEAFSACGKFKKNIMAILDDVEAAIDLDC